jgi:hypothetical protein
MGHDGNLLYFSSFRLSIPNHRYHKYSPKLIPYIMNVVKWHVDTSSIFVAICMHRWGMWQEEEILADLCNKRTVGVNEESATHALCSSLNSSVLCSAMSLDSVRCGRCWREEQVEGQPGMTCSEMLCQNSYYYSREYNTIHSSTELSVYE